jgi:hypothetical protein
VYQKAARLFTAPMATPAGLMAGAFASAFRVPTVAVADGSLFHFNQVQWRLLALNRHADCADECLLLALSVARGMSAIWSPLE